MLNFKSLLVALAGLAVIVSAHDGITQKFAPVSPANLMKGEPTGTMVKIGGVDTYVARPPHIKNGCKEAILFLTVRRFGLPLPNNKLMADRFARETSLPVYVPDYLNGDPIPYNTTTINATEWLPRHGEDVTSPLILSVIGGLKQQGVRTFAATGYCFGGLYAMRLAQNNTVAVSVSAHPSLLTVPEDFEILQAKSKVPIQIHSAELDAGFTPAIAAIADGVMNGTTTENTKRYKPGYTRYAHAGMVHGFAVRPANASDPAQVAELDAAFYAAVKAIKTYL
ncbi:alpha/beta-hydrolase [Auriculariales sp. MPI-PUGE-AT-0066]|nr:alpha/beta-hydrolase [Auriculariales sp. MPI-PUGE-AT-0066]